MYQVTIGAGGEKRALIKKIWYSEKLQAQFGRAKNTVLFDGETPLLVRNVLGGGVADSSIGNKLAWSVINFPFGDRHVATIDLDEGMCLEILPVSTSY